VKRGIGVGTAAILLVDGANLRCNANEAAVSKLTDSENTPLSVRRFVLVTA